MPQRLNSYFSSNKELRQISGKVQQLRALQLHYEQVTPPSLLRASHVLHIEDGILTLAANNGAVAAKLRQLAPELIRQLGLYGCEVTGIQVRVQVTLTSAAQAAHSSTMSLEGKQKLAELASILPDSPLKSALQRLSSLKKAGQ